MFFFFSCAEKYELETDWADVDYSVIGQSVRLQFQ